MHVHARIDAQHFHALFTYVIFHFDMTYAVFLFLFGGFFVVVVFLLYLLYNRCNYVF